jgi:uncharacterized protein YndB with AHSA1/START domain
MMMTKSKFVYVTYISATPEQVWKALLDREFTRQYWDCENVSDWQPGSADQAKHSRVTFEIAPIDEMVRLTVTHDELEAGSEMLQGITYGWPRVLSSLKTLLETGRPLRTWAKNS